MLALKLITFLVLAFAVVGLNMQSSHHKQANSVTFKITEKYQLPTAPFYQWTDFTALGGKFNVGQSGVMLAYSLQFFTNSTDFFVARVLIDGVEDPRFRTISAGSVYKSHFVNLPVYLSEGVHTAKVQFRSMGAVKNNPYDDWNQAYLQINYV